MKDSVVKILRKFCYYGKNVIVTHRIINLRHFLTNFLPKEITNEKTNYNLGNGNFYANPIHRIHLP